MKTDLERSHSKSSNLLLTLITSLSSIGFSTLFVGIGMYEKYNNISIILMIIGGILTLLGLFLIMRFKR